MWYSWQNANSESTHEETSSANWGIVLKIITLYSSKVSRWPSQRQTWQLSAMYDSELDPSVMEDITGTTGKTWMGSED